MPARQRPPQRPRQTDSGARRARRVVAGVGADANTALSSARVAVRALHFSQDVLGPRVGRVTDDVGDRLVQGYVGRPVPRCEMKAGVVRKSAVIAAHLPIAVL